MRMSDIGIALGVIGARIMKTLENNRLTILKKISGALAISLVLLISFAGSAMAQGNPHDVRFNDLHIAKQGPTFVLEYSISKEDWRDLKRVGIEPRLNIYAPDERRRGYQFRYSIPLANRRGAIEYARQDLMLRGAKTVEIELVGYNGASRIRRVSYNRTTDNRIRIPVDRRGGHGHAHGGGHGHGAHGNHHRAALIKACKAETRYDSEMNSCIDRAFKLHPATAARTVKACGEATQYASELNRCLEKSAGITDDKPFLVVAACDRATNYASELNQCIERSKKLSHDPGSVIAACDRHTKYGSELNQCIDAASTYNRRSPVRVVDACGEHTRYSSELNSCIKKARQIRGPRPETIVDACGESTRYASQMFSCMDSSSSASRPSHGHSNGRRADRVAHR